MPPHPTSNWMSFAHTSAQNLEAACTAAITRLGKDPYHYPLVRLQNVTRPYSEKVGRLTAQQQDELLLQEFKADDTRIREMHSRIKDISTTPTLATFPLPAPAELRKVELWLYERVETANDFLGGFGSWQQCRARQDNVASLISDVDARLLWYRHLAGKSSASVPEIASALILFLGEVYNLPAFADKVCQILRTTCVLTDSGITLRDFGRFVERFGNLQKLLSKTQPLVKADGMAVSWWKPTWSRQQAELELERSPSMRFAVRYPSKPQEQFALTVVDLQSRKLHLLLKNSPDGYYCETDETVGRHPTLHSIVACIVARNEMDLKDFHRRVSIATMEERRPSDSGDHPVGPAFGGPVPLGAAKSSRRSSAEEYPSVEKPAVFHHMGECPMDKPPLPGHVPSPYPGSASFVGGVALDKSPLPAHTPSASMLGHHPISISPTDKPSPFGMGPPPLPGTGLPGHHHVQSLSAGANRRGSAEDPTEMKPKPGMMLLAPPAPFLRSISEINDWDYLQRTYKDLKDVTEDEFHKWHSSGMEALLCKAHSRDRPTIQKFCRRRGLRLLSLDGGGIRGLIPAMILVELEKRAKRPITEMFDMICGTSTGGLIAMGITLAKLEPGKLAELYEKDGHTVFPPVSAFRKGVRLLASSRQYSNTGLRSKIQKLFPAPPELKQPQMLCTDAKVPKCFVVATRNTQPPKLHLFRSYKVPSDTQFHPGTADCGVWDAALATAAAPTYFEPHTVNGESFIDGGLSANNPTYVGEQELQGLFPGKALACVVSLGTGEPSYKAQDKGNKLMAIVAHLVDAATDGERVHREASYRHNKEIAQHKNITKYIRLNPGCGAGDVDLAETSHVQIQCMRRATEDYLARPEVQTMLGEIVDICARE